MHCSFQELRLFVHSTTNSVLNENAIQFQSSLALFIVSLFMQEKFQKLLSRKEK